MAVDVCPGRFPRDERHFGNRVADGIAILFMKLPEVEGCCTIEVMEYVRQTRNGVELRTRYVAQRMQKGVVDGLRNDEDYRLRRGSEETVMVFRSDDLQQQILTPQSHLAKAFSWVTRHCNGPSARQ